ALRVVFEDLFAVGSVIPSVCMQNMSGNLLPAPSPAQDFPRKTPPRMYAQIWVRRLERLPLTTFAYTQPSAASRG
ncbi:MAG: hypothetical protein Q8L87_11985, partial [Anaerolineales bacterium]|nr:hypothetical protein [Anaerolineales bacterium]